MPLTRAACTTPISSPEPAVSEKPPLPASSRAASTASRASAARPAAYAAACREIEEGRSVDLIEVDAASRTKVEDTRELLENVQYAPTRSRFKVYLIDEVHMLSGHSFNALLKTLEEPPEHVKFLLATTDPQKLPATVLSRCLQFNLKNLSAERIAGHLSHVLSEEGVAFEEGALWLLGRAAAGSMRDALSLTDQAIAFGNGRLGEAEVASMLGTVDRGHVFTLLDALEAGAGDALLAACAAMDEQGVDFAEAADELASVLHRIAVAQAVPDAVSREFGDAERVVALAASLSAEDVQLFYELTTRGRAQLAQAADPRAAFEMLALRLLAFRPVAPLDPALSPEHVVAAAAPADTSQHDAGEVGGGVKKPEAAAPERAVDSGADTGAASPWHRTLEQLGLSGSAYNVASNCELLAHDDGLWRFRLDAQQGNLFNARHNALLAAALERHCGTPVTVDIVVGEVATETPAARTRRVLAERQREAETAIRSDRRVQRLLEEFDGAVRDGSVTLRKQG
jgi:DNA polymerase-3 subunit gamma/tau